MHLFIILLLYLLQYVYSITNNTQTIYVFAYSWTPGFCINESYPGCVSPLPYWKMNFTIHGLWPQYITSGYPSSCTNEKFDIDTINNIGMDYMIQKWPDVQYDVNTSSYDSFWIHEWSKHGTCSGLSQYDYFNEALLLTNKVITPDFLQQAIGTNVSADALRNSISKPMTLSLQCKKQNLVGVYTCWDQIDGKPTTLINCPPDVLAEDTCNNDDNVYIPSL